MKPKAPHSMDSNHQFAELTDSFIRFAYESSELTLNERVTAARLWLAAIYKSASQLEGDQDTNEFCNIEEIQWPTFGTFDEFWALADPHGHEAPELLQLGEQLSSITNVLFFGLNLYQSGEEQRAINYWHKSFEEDFGPRVLTVLTVLHAAAQNFRSQSSRPTPRHDSASIIMLDDTAKSPPGVMGLRLLPVEGGAEIAAVHPRGPAKGRLIAGDLVIAVDEQPIQGSTSEEVGLELRGACDATRVLSVYRAGETMAIPITLVAPTTLKLTVELRVLIPEAAERASTALTILGCAVSFQEPDLLIVEPAPQVSPADVAALIAAGETNGIWLRRI